MKTRRMGIESLAFILLVLGTSTFGFGIFALPLNSPQQRQALSSFQQEICPATVPGSSDPSQDEWPMFRGQLNHTGEAHTSPVSGIGPLWGFPTGKDFYGSVGGSYQASPTVVGGRVYVNIDKFYCLSAATGGLLWSYNTGNQFTDSCPAVADGRVYAGASGNLFYCWDAITGEVLWNYSMGGCGSPAVADGRVYVGSASKVFCLDAMTGGLCWNYTTRGTVTSSPAVANGRMYVGSNDKKLYCLNATTGGLLWTYTTSRAVESSPAVARGRVYVGSDDDRVYCLNATTGIQLWNYTTGNDVYSSPAVAGGRVYVGSRDARVYCLNATTGGLLWNYTTGDWVRSSPAVAGGRVYVGSWDARVYCLNATTGGLLWNYTTGSYVESSPAVASGRVYVGSEDHKIYCLPCILTNQIVPTAPQNLQAITGNGQISLTWNPPSNNGGSAIMNYKIYRGTVSGGEIYYTTIGNVLTYTNTNLTNGQPYFYKVSAVNGVGEGPQSTEASAIPLTLSITPGNTWTYDDPNGQADRIWDAQPITNLTIPAVAGFYSTITTGEYYNSGISYAKVEKFWGNGLLAWDRTLLGGNIYTYSLISALSNGGVVLSAQDNQANFIRIQSYDANGNTINSYTDYNPSDLIRLTGMTLSGDVWVVGNIEQAIRSIFLLKVSATNNTILFAKTWNPGFNVYAAECIGDNNGGLYMTGFTKQDGFKRLFIAHFNTSGGLIKYISYSNSAEQFGLRIAFNRHLISIGGYRETASDNNWIVYSWTFDQDLILIYSILIYNGSAWVTDIEQVDQGRIRYCWNADIKYTDDQTDNYLVTYPTNSHNTDAAIARVNNLTRSVDVIYEYDNSNYHDYQYLLVITSSNKLYTIGTWHQPYADHPILRIIHWNTSFPIHFINFPSVIKIPTAPQYLQATRGNRHINLTWQAPSNNGGSTVTNYRIYRSTSPRNESLLTTIDNWSSYVDIDVINGKIYYYKVSAVNGVGEGPLSEELSLPAITISAAPRNLQSAARNGFITLTWQPPAYNGCSNITNYIIYRGNASNTEIPLITIGPLLNYTDLGLTNGQTYYYRVSAINGIGEGNISVEVHAKPLSVPNAPSTPLITIENGKIVISWQAPSDNGGTSIISYIIYRGTFSGNETYLVTIDNISCFTDSNLIYGQHYYYRVSAINEVGESFWSAEVVGMVSISTDGNQTFYWIIIISLMASLVVFSGVVFYLPKKIKFLEGPTAKISKAPKSQIGTYLRKKESTQSFEGTPPIKQPPASDEWTNIFSTLEKEFALALLKKIDIEEPNILKES